MDSSAETRPDGDDDILHRGRARAPRTLSAHPHAYAHHGASIPSPHRYSLHFESASAPWTFSALLDGTRLPAKGQLLDVRQHTDRVLPALPAAEQVPVADAQRHFIGGIDGGAPDAPPLVRDVAASGPWFWAGSGPLGFLRGGVLVTPWGEGVWGLERKLTTALGSDVERAPPDAVFADFAGSFHTVRMLTTAPRLFMRVCSSRRCLFMRVCSPRRLASPLPTGPHAQPGLPAHALRAKDRRRRRRHRLCGQRGAVEYLRSQAVSRDLKP